MKPLEIITSLSSWAEAKPETVLDSPAFAMPCQLGGNSSVLRRASVNPAESAMLALSVTFGDEPHRLCLSRSPAFSELDKIWDSREEVPETLLLALVERECGPLFQFLENAVRKQLRLIGIAGKDDDACREGAIPFQVDDVVFSITGSTTVISALGIVRNLDLTHDSVRNQMLPAEIEYASFVLPETDIASLTPGDAILLPEIDTVQPHLVVDNRFVVDENGVSPYVADSYMRVRAADGMDITLGQVFDSIDSPSLPCPAQIGRQLRLVGKGRVVACGRLDRLAGKFAFVAEQTT